MKKKYQIFVSSTYEDLKEERDLVIKAILEMGHIPVGMEMFSAGDEEQWQLIQKQIEDCDYYILISAFRYGSLDGDISYTEKEYNYAAYLGIPILGFIISNDIKWNPKMIDKDELTVGKLNDFKEKVKKRISGFWNDKNDLYGKVSIALMKQFNTNPRTGWVKASEHMGPEVLKEISRLSTENSELREMLKKSENQINNEKKEAFQKLLDTLKHNKREISFFYIGGVKFENPTEFSLMKIFNLLAPNLMIENSTKYTSQFIGIMLNPDQSKSIRKDWPIPSNTTRLILADLSALEIIQPSNKKHKVDDDNEYWTLTAEGKKLFKEVRREILEQNLEKALFPTEDLPF